jgi:hypothetical protein
MDETLLRQMLDQAAADEPPIGPVVDRAVTAGRRVRRRRRRAGFGAIGCAALAVVAVGLVPVLRGSGSGSVLGNRSVAGGAVAAGASHRALSPNAGVPTTVASTAPSALPFASASSAASARGFAGTGSAAACGSFCNDLYLSEYGTKFVASVYKESVRIDTPVIMFAANTTDPGQDLTINTKATLRQFYLAGLVAMAIAQRYGADKAYEIEYTPGGAVSGMCLGVPSGDAGAKVVLEPCGGGAKTVWFSTTVPSPGHAVPVMSAAVKVPGQLLVLSYPASANPLTVPRPALDLEPLAPGALNQEWELGRGPGNAGAQVTRRPTGTAGRPHRLMWGKSQPEPGLRHHSGHEPLHQAGVRDWLRRRGGGWAVLGGFQFGGWVHFEDGCWLAVDGGFQPEGGCWLAVGAVKLSGPGPDRRRVPGQRCGH